MVFLYLATTVVPGMFSKGRTQLYIVRTVESSHEDDESGIGDDVGVGDSEEEALADAGDHYP